MHPSQPRRGPAVRGFKPDIIGTALLFVFLVVGHALITALSSDLGTYFEPLEELGLIGGLSAYELAGLTAALAHAGNFATGLALFILVFGVRGRKLVSLVPFLFCLSPFLFVFLGEPFINATGPTELNRQLFWFLTYGVFYGVALAAWAYGFGRSLPGVVVAGCLGAIALTTYRFAMSQWMSGWPYDMEFSTALAFVIFGPGFDLVIVAVIALSCLVGPGLARSPVAPAPRYAQPPAAQSAAVGPAVAQPCYVQSPAVPPRYTVGDLTWGPTDQ